MPDAKERFMATCWMKYFNLKIPKNSTTKKSGGEKDGGCIIF